MDIVARVSEYQEKLKVVDEVVITIVCCDSRVVMPHEIVEIDDSSFSTNRKKRVIFIPIPVIGSGIPSKSRIRKIIRALLKFGVDKSKLRILITQHGDTKELESQGILSLQRQNVSQNSNTEKSERHISCGLRKFFLANAYQLQQLHELLRRYAEMKKRKTQDKTFAPDRQDINFLKKDCPDIFSLVDKIHKSSGAEGMRVPRRLIVRAAYRNSSFDLSENTNGVAMKISEFLKETENENIYATCAVYEAEYNHQTKTLTFAQYANIGDKENIELPHLTKRNDFIQNPENAVIVYGEKAILYPIELMTDEICTKPDNYFRSVATSLSVPHLLCAFCEISYAVLHHNHPHSGDKNFASMKKIIVICENEDYFKMLCDTIKSDEWIDEYRNIFGYFANQLEVIVLEKNGRISPTKKKLIIV